MQSGLYAAPTLCLDERCVLMRAVWEFNEARWDWAWSYGLLLMWDVLRGFFLLCLYELDTFLWDSAVESVYMYCKRCFMICFPKDCTLVELPVTLTWTVSQPSFDLEDHVTHNNNLKISLSDNSIAPLRNPLIHLSWKASRIQRHASGNTHLK